MESWKHHGAPHLTQSSNSLGAALTEKFEPRIDANKEQQGCEDSRDFRAETSTPCSDAIDPRTEPDVVAITYSRQLASIRGSEQYSFVSIVVAQVPGFPHSLCRPAETT